MEGRRVPFKVDLVRVRSGSQCDIYIYGKRIVRLPCQKKWRGDPLSRERVELVNIICFCIYKVCRLIVFPFFFLRFRGNLHSRYE